MMTGRYTLFIALMLFACSCSTPDRENSEETASDIPPEERTEKALQDEVIAIHDEVMPKMDNLMRLKGKLQAKIDSIRNTEDPNQEQIQEYISMTVELRKADSAMMNWMRQFKAVRDSISHEERIEYLEREKERIEEVKAMMNNAIEEATKMVKQ